MPPPTGPPILPPLTGSVPDLVTPMRSAGELDLPGLARLVEQAAGDGADSVLVAGPTGEGPLLTPADRRAVTVAAAETGVPVIAGASGATLDAVHADVERLAGAGAAAVLVLAPAVLPLTADEVVAAHTAVADRAAAPTLVLHVPQLTGASLTPETVARLAGHDGVIGLVDASDDDARRAAFVRRGGNALAVLTAWTPTTVVACRAGAGGAVLPIANLRGSQVAALLRGVDDGNDATADESQASLAAAEAALQAVGGSLAAAIKAALQLAGRLDERWCMPPLASVPGNRLDRVRTALLR